ncbi:major facilitator superfamily domain-containing protein [Irpex rosettiformis]|uniref:Major facilitator superfamily domain-containing protein n=1 Tax=Irpex rosettiformis TaxID=378272 RepID=A0ACB8TR15_9APHY|nr:major facilitator superfamily domain-containing protein [Irpex rosettiformis]
MSSAFPPPAAVALDSPSSDAGSLQVKDVYISSEKVAQDAHEGVIDRDRRAEKRALLKVDLVVIPLVGMYYLLSFIDRSNIGNARIAGLQKTLNMSNTQFSTALTITYVPYILMELPMNLLMKRLGANNTLPIMVALWGMVCACQGAVKTYGGLLACRFFLGALEGGLFPGIVLYMSTFYKRHEMQLRFSMMFSATSLAGAFSGLLAAGIENMDGVRGLSGWAWIFILEGVFTTLFGLITFFLRIPSSPNQISPLILTPHERSTYCAALGEDWSADADVDGEEPEVFSWKEVGSVFTLKEGLHVWLICVPLFFSGVTLFGLANFTPTIVNALGYGTTHTQLLTVPPYACSFVLSIVCSYLCDKYKQRGAMAVGTSLLAAVGYAIFLGSKNKHADYAALFLQIIGVYAGAPCLSTWNSNNVQPHYRRATAIACAFAATNIGGIVSTWIFIDPPRFHTATSINLAFSLAMAAFCAIIMIYLDHVNERKKREIERLEKEGDIHGGESGWDSRRERRRLGDRHPRFVYTL